MKCFACGRKLSRNPHLVDTRDDQTVLVGSECYKLIKAAGEGGYAPPLGGPRLYLISRGLSSEQIDQLRWSLDNETRREAAQ